MSKEKHVEEIKRVICEICISHKYCDRDVIICPQAEREAEHLYNAGYRKQSEGEWLSAYDYALKLGITDEKRLSDAKEDWRWKFCNKCEEGVKGCHNYCPNCGAKMKGGEE